MRRPQACPDSARAADAQVPAAPALPARLPGSTPAGPWPARPANIAFPPRHAPVHPTQPPPIRRRDSASTRLQRVPVGQPLLRDGLHAHDERERAALGREQLPLVVAVQLHDRRRCAGRRVRLAELRARAAALAGRATVERGQGAHEVRRGWASQRRSRAGRTPQRMPHRAGTSLPSRPPSITAELTADMRPQACLCEKTEQPWRMHATACRLAARAARHRAAAVVIGHGGRGGALRLRDRAAARRLLHSHHKHRHPAPQTRTVCRACQQRPALPALALLHPVNWHRV